MARQPVRLRALPAPVFTLSILAFAVVVIQVLGYDTPRTRKVAPAGATNPEFAAGVSWLTWRAVAAVALVAFLVLFASGVRCLRDRRSYSLGSSRTRTAAYVVVAATLVGAGIALVVWSGGRNPAIPIRHLAWRTRAVLFTGLTSVIPWFVVAWLCHDRCRAAEDRPWDHPGALDVPSYAELRQLWSVLVRCTQSFAVGVAAALLTSGALRFAFLDANPGCDPKAAGGRTGCVEDFPATYILLYGAVFALVGLAIVVPLLSAWRGQATRWVHEMVGEPGGIPDPSWVEKKTRLEKLLGLDRPILRDPLTLLSVFTPLATSLLATFLPQLG